MRLGTTSNKYFFILFLFVIAASVMFPGCSTKKHYNVLKIFFDGVPKPGAIDATNVRNVAQDKVNQGQKKTKAPEKWVKMKSRHPDFFKNVCKNCHDRTSSNFLRVDKKEDLCYTCHKPEQFDGAFVHGPVAVKACLTCHLPHESQYPRLLKKEARELCASCHLHKNIPTPDACNRGENCTGCHYPHAGDNRFFLKLERG
jgi:predicted CXXCH cytochrome family protein